MADGRSVGPTNPDDVSGSDAETIALPGNGAEVAGGALPRIGERFSRYVVIDKLGGGAMGDVFRAYDPRLRREVALKLLRTPTDERARMRIVREARTMAQLTHPNVVAIHDVDTEGGRPFIAMELVEGTTLRQWMSAATRTWPEIVEVFVAAGRGLAAAHRAGIVHRDFKPGNVLLANDPLRVLVTDFGLARGGEPGSTQHSRASQVSGGSEPADELDALDDGDAATVEGTVVGTPAYMAPEQHAGKVVDARSDQYALCVTLWEAAYGRRPFSGPKLVELAKRKRALSFSEPEPGRKVPASVRRILVRGLSPDPEDRFESIDALLAALSRDPGRTRRWLIAGAVVTGTVGAGVAAWQMQEAARLAECQTQGDAIDAAWSPTIASSVSERFDAVDPVGGPQAYDRVAPALDAFAERWRAQRVDVCLTGVPGPRLRSKEACLEERKAELEAVVGVFAEADRATLVRAVPAATGMKPLSQCADETWLRQRLSLPADPKLRAAVAEHRRALSRAGSLSRAGRYDDAQAAVDEIQPAVDRLGFAPLVAELRAAQGELADLHGDYERARGHLEAAYFAAGALGQDTLAADMASILSYLVGYRLGEHEPGMTWGRTAQMLLERLGQDNTVWAGHVQNNFGTIEAARRNLAASLRWHQRALETRTGLLGLEHPDVASSFNNIGYAYYLQKDYELARSHYEQAVAIGERVLGPTHPTNALPLINLGILEFDLRAYEDALDYYREALALYEDAYGVDSVMATEVMGNIGRVHFARGQYDMALAFHERCLSNIGRELSTDDPWYANTLNDVGQTWAELGQPLVALPLYERARVILRADGEGSEEDLAFTLMLIGRAHLDAGDPVTALPWLEESVQMHERIGAKPAFLADAQFPLARALWL